MGGIRVRPASIGGFGGSSDETVAGGVADRPPTPERVLGRKLALRAPYKARMFVIEAPANR